MNHPSRSPAATKLPSSAMRPVLAVGAVLLVAVWACEAGRGDPASASTVRDSAGVRVVSHASGLDGARVVTPELVSQHGHGPDDYSFGRVSTGTLSSDGSAVVWDGLNQELLALGREGDSVAVLATGGAGPREVRRVLSLHAAGPDSVWVEDDGNGRIVLFVGGEPVRSIGTREDPTLNTGLVLNGLDGAGRFLMSTSSYRSDFEMPWLPGRMVVLDPETRQPDTVGSYDMAPRRRQPRNPFAPYGAVAASGGSFVYGRSDLPEIRWTDPDGSLRQVVRWEAEPLYPEPAHWEGFVAAMRAELERINPRMSGEALSGFVDEQIGSYEMDRDEPLPMFARIEGDDSGSVWLPEFIPRPGATPQRYRAISGAGELRGVVEFPHPFRLLGLRGDLALGVVKDEMDVEGVALFRVDFDDIGGPEESGEEMGG